MPTEYQINLMKHACGFESSKPFYRNHFASCPEDKDDLEWKKLVSGGYAKLIRTPGELFPYNGYSITEKGKTFLKGGL